MPTAARVKVCSGVLVARIAPRSTLRIALDPVKTVITEHVVRLCVNRALRVTPRGLRTPRRAAHIIFLSIIMASASTTVPSAATPEELVSIVSSNA